MTEKELRGKCLVVFNAIQESLMSSPGHYIVDLSFSIDHKSCGTVLISFCHLGKGLQCLTHWATIWKQQPHTFLTIFYISILVELQSS
jgi:hypothetical protein